MATWHLLSCSKRWVGVKICGEIRQIYPHKSHTNTLQQELRAYWWLINLFRDILNWFQALIYLLGLHKGLNEVCKALDRKQALLCVLAENCDDPKYKKLITALAKSNGIPVITIDNRNDIGEWLGHCKYDKEGKARKVKGTSSVAIVDYGEETEALTFVLNYIKEKNLWAIWWN